MNIVKARRFLSEYKKLFGEAKVQMHIECQNPQKAIEVMKQMIGISYETSFLDGLPIQPDSVWSSRYDSVFVG